MSSFQHAFALAGRRFRAALVVAGFLAAATALARAEKAKADGESAAAVVEKTPEGALPFLWKVVPPGEGKHSYLFGTFHTSDPRVLARLGQVDWAVQEADALYTELEMDMASQLQVVTKILLPNGKTLADVVPPKTYRKLRDYSRKRGLGMAQFDRMRPWMVATQLSLHEIEGFNPADVLDARLYGRAVALGREAGGVEKLEEQLAVFESLTMEEQAKFLDAAIDYLVDHPGEAKRQMEELVQRYLSGDEDSLMRFMEEAQMQELMDDDDEEMKKLGERLMRRLLQDRNHVMAERMADKMRTRPEKAFFFAVGLAHYPGDEGVLKLLRDDGFMIERVPESEYAKRVGEDWNAAPAAPVEEKPAASYPKGSLADRFAKKKK